MPDPKKALLKTPIFLRPFAFFLTLSWVFFSWPEISFQNKYISINFPPEIQEARADDWFDSNYGYRKKLTIDDALVSGASNLSNFPILVSYTDADLKHVGEASPGQVENTNGYDIIFADSSHTPAQLDHEIESYTASSGEIVMWVRIPTLSFNTPTDIYIYYGNSSIASTQEDVAGVWDANHLAVWHLDQDPGPGGADEMADSTQYGRHATAVAAMLPGDSVAGKVGKGIDFDGTGKVIEDADGELYINGLTAYTLSAWIESDLIATDKGFLTGKIPDGTDNSFGIRYDDAGTNGGGDDVIKAGVTVVAEKNIESSVLIQTLNWQHVSLTWTSGGQLTLYVDGILNTPSNNPAAFSGSVSTTTTFLIGIGPKTGSIGTAGWDGIVDEVHISDIARSLDWIKTEYNNQNNQGTGTGKFIKTLG